MREIEEERPTRALRAMQLSANCDSRVVCPSRPSKQVGRRPRLITRTQRGARTSPPAAAASEQLVPIVFVFSRITTRQSEYNLIYNLEGLLCRAETKLQKLRSVKRKALRGSEKEDLPPAFLVRTTNSDPQCLASKRTTSVNRPANPPRDWER